MWRRPCTSSGWMGPFPVAAAQGGPAAALVAARAQAAVPRAGRAAVQAGQAVEAEALLRVVPAATVRAHWAARARVVRATRQARRAPLLQREPGAAPYPAR